MKEKTSNKEGFRFLALVLYHRQRMIEEWGVDEELVVSLKDEETLKKLARYGITPLAEEYVIHPGTHEVISIPEGMTIQRNVDGTAVQIRADGEPVFQKKEES